MNRKLFRLVLLLGLAAVIMAGALRAVPLFRQKSVQTITSSTLTKAIDIADLSTAEFQYRGIAEVYRDDSRRDIVCRVAYYAVVKAGISMEDVLFDVDPETKVVTAALPEIGLKVSMVDEQSMFVLPSDANVTIDQMLQAGKEDAAREAAESGALQQTARENLESVIRALLLPILKSQGYTLAFQ